MIFNQGQKRIFRFNTIIYVVGSFLNKMNVMKPMGLNSTHFFSYQEIKVEDIDLIEDAWGFNSEFIDVIALLGHINAVPGKGLTETLIEKIRKLV